VIKVKDIPSSVAGGVSQQVVSEKHGFVSTDRLSLMHWFRNENKSQNKSPKNCHDLYGFT